MNGNHIGSFNSLQRGLVNGLLPFYYADESPLEKLHTAAFC